MAGTPADSTIQLFDVGHAKPRKARRAKPPKPPSPADETLRYYRTSYQERSGRDLILPSKAAWAEVMRHCKRLVALVPDKEQREAFLDCWLALRDRYVADRGYPLRLALRDERFQQLLRAAVRVVAERRRVVPLAEPAPAVVATVAPVAPVRPVRQLGKQWCVEARGADGRVLGADTVVALSQVAAEKRGARLLARAMEMGEAVVLVATEIQHG